MSLSREFESNDSLLARQFTVYERRRAAAETLVERSDSTLTWIGNERGVR